MKRTLSFLLGSVFAACIPFICVSCSSAPAASADIASISSTGTETAQSTGEPTRAEAGYPVEVTDFLDATTKIESADRVVSLAPSCTEVLEALDVEEHIIGVDSSSADMIPGIDVVGDYASPDVEKITALEPDVVIAANYIQNDAIERLRALGIPVVAAEPTSWEQVPVSFELIASVMDRREAGRALADELQGAAETAQQNAPADPVSCYYVLSYGNAGNWTSGEGSFINTMLEYAGGAPITAGTASTWLEYPIEDLAAKDPECIILASSAGTIEDFMQTAGYTDLTAVRDGHVYAVDESLVSVPGPGLAQGLTALSEILQQVREVSAAA